MKKILLMTLLVSFIAVPCLFAQFRLDVGVDIPLSIGFTSPEGIGSVDPEITKFLTSHILPFPEIGAHYFFNVGYFRFGLGVRGFTFILESVLWPNAVAEFEISKFVLEAQFGGGAFLFFGLLNIAQTGAVFFPDISAWFKLGETFRLGGGILGVTAPKLELTGVPYVLYLGGKAAIKF